MAFVVEDFCNAELDRTVAIKIPRKGQLDPHESEQFLREARAAAQLRPPNIVSVLASSGLTARRQFLYCHRFDSETATAATKRAVMMMTLWFKHPRLDGCDQ